MKIADKTEEYYSDPKSGMESVDNDDDDDYVYSSESSSCEMNDSDKWIFSTGKIVEDALYNFGIKCRHERLTSQASEMQ
ncbi:unnamed protein product [Rhizophagus irregularis]|nr:unnamed protein product [Rhizophagus irregularis]CAB5363624.1 unnamed protein product [Rhizophagus irregularis]